MQDDRSHLYTESRPTRPEIMFFRRLRSLAVAGLVTLSMLVGSLPAVAADRHPPGDDAVIDLTPLEGLVPLDAITVDFDDAYDSDPMGIVAYSQFSALFTQGDEPWDVWICRPPGENHLGLELGAVVDTLNDTTADYYDTISEGRYRPVFRERGTSTDPECGIGLSHSGTTPQMYVNDFSVLEDDRNSAVGQGSPGTISWSPTAMIYEGVQRRAEIDGASVTEIPAYEYSPAASIAAHEIGHTIHWAHSGAVDDYDNELDLMSLGWGGTHAFNLYSAGWIEPTQVALHHGGDKTYSIGPLGWSGTRMVVITTGTEGLFYTLSVRAPDEPVLDANSEPVVDAVGVEVYRIDQRPEACSPIPDESPCFGILGQVEPYPGVAAPFPGPYPHYHPAGTNFEVAGVPVAVEAGSAGTLSVRVSGGLTGSGWFLDDDTSVFEADIEWAAMAGITLGCNPPKGDHFCPNEPVTRGEMAAFLVRTLNLPASSVNSFGDDDGSVFEADINSLAASGTTTGCTTTSFCPDDSVTRGQMAAFLNRAYDLAVSGTDNFDDDGDSVFEADINALAASGITTGCTPTSFCPDDPVTRGQMAAFLNRAENR